MGPNDWPRFIQEIKPAITKPKVTLIKQLNKEDGTKEIATKSMAISILNSKQKNNNCKEQIEQAIEEKPEGTNPIQMKGKKITSAKQEPTLPSISKSRPKIKRKSKYKTNSKS